VRSLTPVEAAVAVAILGSVLATALPSFVRNLHASALVEPIDGLGRIATRATALAASRPIENAYPGTVGLTPATVPAGQRATDPPGTWDHATWRELGFSQTVPHAFSFEFESKNAPDISTFRAIARGDLDGDGSLSTFEIGGHVSAGGEPTVGALDMSREVE
jgi:hypothetical protein